VGKQKENERYNINLTHKCSRKNICADSSISKKLQLFQLNKKKI